MTMDNELKQRLERLEALNVAQTRLLLLISARQLEPRTPAVEQHIAYLQGLVERSAADLEWIASADDWQGVSPGSFVQ